MNSTEIRQRFIDYYEDMGYQQLPRAPMLDPSIPMSFVMSAGLVQVETSLAKSNHRDGDQFVLVQKCFRHFDLEKVGTDNIHLSLFEMPGAFVFGPNGKPGTVRRMWKLATSVLGIEKEKIWVSYFRGGKVLDNYLPEDITTRQAWAGIGIPENRIIGLGPDHNYWVQGKGIRDIDTLRKCGPNTELFFDRGLEKACGQSCKPGCKCGRFIEFSNSLFVGYEFDEKTNSLHSLNDPFTETVIGTERISMIGQGVNSVFETDEYKPLLEIIDGFFDRNEVNLEEPMFTTNERIIADHVKALYYLVADGAPPPGKDGRQRIIKILIRRIITSCILLGVEAQNLIPLLIENIPRTTFLESQEKWFHERLLSYFYSEAKRFLKTITRGEKKLLQFLQENNGHTLSGDQIVCLEKQWGLPSLLTFNLLQELGLDFLEAEYKSALTTYIQSDNNLISGRSPK